MSFSYIDPISRPVKSDAWEVFCCSDTHMGNNRLTNDLHGGRRRDRVLKFLRRIKTRMSIMIANPDPEYPKKMFDVVFHGDIFDFWKAIRNPLPDETLQTLGSRLDYGFRFKEILDYNSDILSSLASILCQSGDPQLTPKFFFLFGNHDDPIEYNPGLYRNWFMQKITQEAKKLFPGSPSLLSAISTNVKFGDSVYWNKPLKLYIEHGHRFDDHNKRRIHPKISGNTISEGQIIVEGFLNGLHDLNLNPNYFSIKFYANSSVRKALRLIDNFYKEQDALAHISKACIAAKADDIIYNLLGQAVAMFINANFDPTLTMSIAAGIAHPDPAKAALLIQAALLIRRMFLSDECRKGAEEILNGNDKYTKGITGNVIPKIVVLGHTHINYAEEELKSIIVKRQYCNTGTFVDIYKKRPPNQRVYPEYLHIRHVPYMGIRVQAASGKYNIVI